MSVVGRTTDTAVLTGVDRLATIPDISSFEAGKLITNVVVVPGVFARLKNVARSFQRIRYNYLRFRVEPQTSSATSGGYVSAFIRDPADVVPGGDELLPYLTAQKGSVTTKWWQNSVINPGTFPGLFYTSEGVEIREFSPGRFVLASDGKATQKGNLTVFAEWGVTLSVASLETDKAVVPVATILKNLYVRTKLTELYFKNEKGEWKNSPISEMISGAHADAEYRLPVPVAIQEAADTVRTCWFVKATAADTLKLGRESPSDSISGNLSEAMVLPKGLVIDTIDAAPAGFRVSASESTSTPKCSDSSMSSQPLSTQDLASSLMQLTKLVSELCQQRASWELRDSHRSMASPPRSEASWSIHTTGDQDAAFDEASP